jgi:hypothetical protein
MVKHLGSLLQNLEVVSGITLGGGEDIPLRQNVDNLLAHYERRIVQNTCRSNTILGNGQLFIEKGFHDQEQPSFKWELSWSAAYPMIHTCGLTVTLNMNMPFITACNISAK